MYTVYLRLTEKLVVNYVLFVLIERFFASTCSAEVLRANIDWKSVFLNGSGSLLAKFSRRMGCPPPTIFFHDREASETLTTLLLTVFTQRNFVANILQVKCTFRLKTYILRF